MTSLLDYEVKVMLLEIRLLEELVLDLELESYLELKMQKSN